MLCVGLAFATSYLGGWLAAYYLRPLPALGKILLVLSGCYSALKVCRIRETSVIEASAELALLLLCVAVVVVTFRLDPFIDAFQRKLRQEINMPEVLSWVEVTMQRTKEDLRILSHTEFPRSLMKGSFRGPDGIRVIADKSSGQPHAELIWGTTMAGSWGLMIGSSNFVGSGTEWQPGVYFRVWR